MQTHTSQAPAKSSLTPLPRAVLQRACACGKHSGSGGECAECRQKREGSLQRAAVSPTPLSETPSSVQSVLRSSGQPLDPGARALLEPRFGHDFSAVRVHTDASAAASARQVNALAYTVGEHIAFESAHYRPGSPDGRKLIAHELTHVIQQSHGSTGPGASESRLEAEAEQTANAVSRGSGSTSVTGLSAPALQRQQGGAQTTAPAPQRVVQPVAPSQRQQALIDAARRAAAIRAQVAMFRVGGIVPSGPTGLGRPSASTEMQRRARALAQIRFHWPNPNMEQIGEIISTMVNRLTSGVQVMVAGANDPECGSRAAYVRGHRPPVVVCPAFFRDTPEQQTRTLLHESAHLAGIGTADNSETYDADYDCGTSFGEFEAADSWAHYIHCLSGQTPDVPTTIQGRPQGGQQGQPPAQRGSGAHP